MFQFFSFPPSLFLCLLSKTTWANIASCHIKAIPCILQRREFCSWMELQSSQTPSHRLHTWGVKTEEKKKRLFLFEPEFVPWGQTHYGTVKEVFHAITEQIDVDEMLGVLGDLHFKVFKLFKNNVKMLSTSELFFFPWWWHCHMIVICQVWYRKTLLINQLRT